MAFWNARGVGEFSTQWDTAPGEVSGRWHKIDAVARLLGPPLMVASIVRTGAFESVVTTPGSAGGDLRLDTAIVQLQPDFQTKPAMVRFTMRAYLVDEKTRQVVAWCNRRTHKSPRFLIRTWGFC